MNQKLPLILAVAMALIAGLLALFNWNTPPPQFANTGEPAAVHESIRPTTYTPPVNTYLPVMMFLVVKDTDKPVFTRCKNMTYRVIDTYSRRENDDLVREDRRLKTLARLIYNECIDVALLTHLEGI